MSTFQDIVTVYNGYDLDNDGLKEIESLHFMSFENPSETITSRQLVIVLVESRLLANIPGSHYSPADLLQRLQVLKSDLLAEGFQTRFLEMKAYNGPIHQDGKTLLAIREFFKNVRDTFPSLKGALLVGAFPESMICRTWPDWRTLTNSEKIDELGKTFPAGTKVYNIGRGIHAYRSEIVLADLSGNWRNLYYQQHPGLAGCVFVPVSETLSPDGSKVSIKCPTGNYEINLHPYEDFFWIKDDEWQEVSLTANEIEILLTLKLQDPELDPADRTQPNPIVRPEICVSRINAKNIATSPDPRLLDVNRRPKICPNSPAFPTDQLDWQPDSDLERSLLIDFFERNHAFRTGRYSAQDLRISKIQFDLGFNAVDQGLNGIDVPGEDQEAVMYASLLDYIKWLKKPATIRGISAHASDTATFFRDDQAYASIETESGGHPWRWIVQGSEYVPSFQGHYTADLSLHRTLWENKVLQDVCPSFFLHTGCDVNTPGGADVMPYSASGYGAGQNAECILFYANALALLSRSKMFYDGPSGFGTGFGASDKALFGDGWIEYFQVESLDVALAQNRTDRKRSSFWSVIGDWTLRKNYLCESLTTHFRLRYIFDPAAITPHGDETVRYVGEVIGHCYANGSVDILQDNVLLAVGNLPTTPLFVQKIAIWLEYFYRLFGCPPYTLEYVKAGKLVEVTIGKGPSISFPADGTPKIGIDAPATDQDIPGVCLKALLSLEFVKTGTWPEWILPPFVSQAAVVQVPALIAPDGYADFHNSYKPCEWMIVYDAQWIASSNGRKLKIDVNKPLNPKMVAYVFLKFDNKAMRVVSLTLTGPKPDGTEAGTQVSMASSSDPLYNYGTFQPENTWSSNYWLKLEVQAVRSWQNNVLKALIGDGIDSNPLTIASVDGSNVGSLAFLNVETGVDENHKIEIGTQDLYEPVQLLVPDEFDTNLDNNSFSTAFKLSLTILDAPHKIGVMRKDQMILKDLNFHDQQDVDYFDVSYHCPTYDDTDEANRPRSGGTNNYWGITYSHLPPNLSCSLSPTDLHCIDFDVFKYDAVNPVLYASDSQSIGCSIDSPTRRLGAKRCYFVFKNHNFAIQGAFAYTLRISYSSAYDSIEINTLAPGYTQGSMTPNRKFLDQLYSRIDKPRPPEYKETIIRIDDVASFVKGYEQFLMDPGTIAMVDKHLQKDCKTEIAEGMHFLGQVAETFGRYDDSEHFYRESAAIFSVLGDKARTVDTLESLEALYKKLGKTAASRSVEKQIRNI